MSERNDYIDFLRFLGLSLIILAHVNSPSIIHQIRCFDVPMMLFVSGLSYSGKKMVISWKNYFFPRIKRLLIPTYLFLTFYFLILWIFGSPIQFRTIVKSFLLMQSGSIGYVWIINVFLLVSLLVPILSRINEQLNLAMFGTFIVVLFLLQEALIFVLSFWNPNSSLLLSGKESVESVIAYSIPFLFGLRLRFSTKKDEWIVVCVVTFVAFLLLGYIFIRDDFAINIVPRYKYPPRIFYLAYGVFASVVLWFLKRWLHLPMGNFFRFVGQNTMWIYLWHILAIWLVDPIIGHWTLKYLAVYTIALCIFYIQYRIVNRQEKQSTHGVLKYLVG